MINHGDILHFLNHDPNGSETRDHSHKHILVADDNHANRLIVKLNLERGGYKVTLAENGLEAVQAVEAMTKLSCTYDTILMDIHMPVMDGITALRHIKDIRPKVKIFPIFAITACCNPTSHQNDIMQSFEAVEILNTLIINQLRSVADATALRDIQQKYWIGVQAHSQTIKSFLPVVLKAAPDALTELRESVHAIKGSSASIGLLRAVHIARHLENAPTSNIAGLLQALFKTLIMSKGPLNKALSEPRLNLPPANLNAANLNCEVAPLSYANARIR